MELLFIFILFLNFVEIQVWETGSPVSFQQYLNRTYQNITSVFHIKVGSDSNYVTQFMNMYPLVDQIKLVQKESSIW